MKEQFKSITVRWQGVITEDDVLYGALF